MMLAVPVPGWKINPLCSWLPLASAIAARTSRRWLRSSPGDQVADVGLDVDAADGCGEDQVGAFAAGQGADVVGDGGEVDPVAVVIERSATAFAISGVLIAR